MPTEPRGFGHDIVVVGASAGGVEALRQVVATLPQDLAAAIFTVIHVPAIAKSVLPAILQRAGDLPAAHAEDEEPIVPGRIYVAPPDHHLLVRNEIVRVVRSAKENGYRPAIDPLFRSASTAFGPRVIGVVLSGVLDDGTAGLHSIKSRGGRTLVQSPDDALYEMMPRSAIDAVNPDAVLPASQLGAAIVSMVAEPAPAYLRNSSEPLLVEEDFVEVDRSSSEQPRPGQPSGFTCPDCGGALWEDPESGVPMFRCRTGHGFGLETLLAEQSERVEGAVWAAIRALEERAAMARRLSARFRARHRRSTADRYERDADASVQQALVLRRALHEHEASVEVEHRSSS